MNWIDEFCGAPTSITTWLFPAIIGPLQIVTGLSQARSVMAMRPGIYDFSCSYSCSRCLFLAQ